MEILTKKEFLEIKEEAKIKISKERKEELIKILLTKENGEGVSKDEQYMLVTEISNSLHNDWLEVSTQVCPVCGNKVIDNPRYPTYVCSTCMANAENEQQQKVQFFNEDMGVGCIGFIRGTQIPYESNICFINGVKCIAQEAYMGGIVIQPVK